MADEEFERTCEHCGEQNPVEFTSCWNCHEELPELATPVPRREKRSVARSRMDLLLRPRVDDLLSPSAVPDRAHRKLIVAEVTAVLLLFWLPAALSGVHSVLHAAGEQTWWDDLLESSYLIGEIAVIGYLAWRAGALGPTLTWCRRRLWEEPLWAVVIVFAAIFTSYPAAVLRELLDFPRWTRNDLSIEVHSASWYLRPATLLLFALAEELLFRAYLWARLTQLTRRPFLALVYSSALFASYHVYDPLDTLSVFLFGALMCLVYARSRSLWRVTLAHWMFNLALFYSP